VVSLLAQLPYFLNKVRGRELVVRWGRHCKRGGRGTVPGEVSSRLRTPVVEMEAEHSGCRSKPVGTGARSRRPSGITIAITDSGSRWIVWKESGLELQLEPGRQTQLTLDLSACFSRYKQLPRCANPDLWGHAVHVTLRRASSAPMGRQPFAVICLLRTIAICVPSEGGYFHHGCMPGVKQANRNNRVLIDICTSSEAASRACLVLAR
jgi:hypothetical protein